MSAIEKRTRPQFFDETCDACGHSQDDHYAREDHCHVCPTKNRCQRYVERTPRANIVLEPIVEAAPETAIVVYKPNESALPWYQRLFARRTA